MLWWVVVSTLRVDPSRLVGFGVRRRGDTTESCSPHSARSKTRFLGVRTNAVPGIVRVLRLDRP
jgi:hypothetical protein